MERVPFEKYWMSRWSKRRQPRWMLIRRRNVRHINQRPFDPDGLVETLAS
jgi:hypothetical protein